MTGFEYSLKPTELNPDDTVLMMNNGYPELFNEDKEQLDYSRVQKHFSEVAENSTLEIIEHLVQIGKKWRGESPQNDDISFIVK